MEEETSIAEPGGVLLATRESTTWWRSVAEALVAAGGVPGPACLLPPDRAAVATEAIETLEREGVHLAAAGALSLRLPLPLRRRGRPASGEPLSLLGLDAARVRPDIHSDALLLELLAEGGPTRPPDLVAVVRTAAQAGYDLAEVLAGTAVGLQDIPGVDEKLARRLVAWRHRRILSIAAVRPYRFYGDDVVRRLRQWGFLRLGASETHRFEDTLLATVLRLPPEILRLEVTEIPGLSRRVLNAFGRAGIRHVGTLAEGWWDGRLLGLKNLGEGGLETIHEGVRELERRFFEKGPAAVLTRAVRMREAAAAAPLLDLLRRRMAGLRGRDRRIAAERVLGDPPASLREMGARLSISPERVRQRVRRNVLPVLDPEGALAERADERLHLLCADPARPLFLGGLGRSDPWFAGWEDPERLRVLFSTLGAAYRVRRGPGKSWIIAPCPGAKKPPELR